jgi:hypothetical protein
VLDGAKEFLYFQVQLITSDVVWPVLYVCYILHQCGKCLGPIWNGVWCSCIRKFPKTSSVNNKLIFSKKTQIVVQGRSTHSLWAKCCPWQCYFACKGIQNEKMSFTLFLAKPRQKAKAIFKTCDLFIYGDMCLIANSMCKNMLRKMTPKSMFWIALVHKIFLLSAGYFFIAYDVYKNQSEIIHTVTHIHYSFFILCIQFQAAHMQAKFCWSWPRSWAHLF